MSFHMLEQSQGAFNTIGDHIVLKRAAECDIRISGRHEHYGREDNRSRASREGHECDTRDDDHRTNEKLLAISLQPLDRVIHGSEPQGMRLL